MVDKCPKYLHYYTNTMNFENKNYSKILEIGIDLS